jgi:hypothetical protein
MTWLVELVKQHASRFMFIVMTILKESLKEVNKESNLLNVNGIFNPLEKRSI